MRPDEYFADDSVENTMQGLKEGYAIKLPRVMVVLLAFIALFGVLVLVYFAFGVFGVRLLNGAKDLGPQGDFFGGHLAAIVGSFTLLVVVLTSFLQIQQDRRFRVREMFLNGISAISSYEVQKPGAEQAMRILDYLALVAFQLKDDELFLILNTVITKDIRRTLEEIEEKGRREYPNAVAAKQRIGTILETHYKALSNSVGKPAA